jgi:hypothetical protein
MTTKKTRRSRVWYGKLGRDGFIRRSGIKTQGSPDHAGCPGDLASKAAIRVDPLLSRRMMTFQAMVVAGSVVVSG